MFSYYFLPIPCLCIYIVLDSCCQSSELISYFLKSHSVVCIVLQSSTWHLWMLSYILCYMFSMYYMIYLSQLHYEAAKSLQSCLTLCNPIGGSPPGSPVPGILRARTLEWVAISFSNAWNWKVKMKSLSRVWLLATPWTAAHQAPPSMGFSRQEYWSGLSFPSPALWSYDPFIFIL